MVKIPKNDVHKFLNHIDNLLMHLLYISFIQIFILYKHYYN